MNIAEFTIKNKLLSIIVILIVVTGGWSAYKNMARFEDPEFTIRVAQINTAYPGASPQEVAEEVTDPLEKALQQLQEVEKINSTSSPGMSEVKVEIKYEFSRNKSDLQLIWNKVRNKVGDAERYLPPGVGSPIVNDDFGDVYGLYFFLTGDGYSPRELREYAKDVQNELLLVDDVGKVAISGAEKEAIFVEISRENAVNLGVSQKNIYNILAQQNAVLAAGDVKIGDQRLLIDPSGGINSVDTIENLLISATPEGKIIYLKDIANVWRGYQDPPDRIFKYNGKFAIALGVSNVLGANVVKMGQSIDDKLVEINETMPIGMELHEYYHQGKIVAASVQAFVLNVVAALAIVIVTLLIFMGFRSAVVIGSILLLTILATLATMELSGIPMHRVSLGALIIALGMMVDNAIVVTEGIQVGVQKGRRKLDIAKAIVSQTKWPLLGGTLVGIIAFAPIGFAPGQTAEFTNHLFWVIMISLLYSWIFALTLTPLFCFWLFKENVSKTAAVQKDSTFIRLAKEFTRKTLSLRWLVIGTAFVLLILAVWGFRFVQPGFFPASTTPQIVIDYWLPQGTDIYTTEKDLDDIASYLGEIEGIEAVQTLAGSGGLRFTLVYSPQSPNSAYGQILVRVDDYRKIDDLLPEIQHHIDSGYPNAQAKVWRFIMGPGGGSKIEATFKGPDPEVIRGLADQAKSIMSADGRALSIRDDWRQVVSVIEPMYNEQNGRNAGISREDLAQALQTNFSGKTVGVYREEDDLIPIIARAPASERRDINNIASIQVIGSTSNSIVPIAQITDGFKTIWRDGQVKREDRKWTIMAQCDPYPGEMASTLFDRLRPQIEAITLPQGYTLEWDGEHGDSKESNEDLASTLPMGLAAMVLVVIVLFGKLRQPIIIWMTVPFAIIGVVIGLTITQTPLEFMGILGVLSLSGLLIKNAIVLIDQVDFEIKNDKPRYDAVVDATASRVRPVMMGSLTTVLGVAPLFFDAFFKTMSVVLVFGLSFATLLTLVVVPALYSVFFRITPQETQYESK